MRTEVDPRRLMVSVGTGLIHRGTLFAYDGMRERGLKAVSPLVVQMYMPTGQRSPSDPRAQGQGRGSAPWFRLSLGFEAAIANAWRNIVLGEPTSLPRRRD